MRKGVLEFGDGGVEHHVGLGEREQFFERGIDKFACERGDAGEEAEVLADFRGININATDDIDPRLGGGELQGFETDGAESVLRDANFFTHARKFLR